MITSTHPPAAAYGGVNHISRGWRWETYAEIACAAIGRGLASLALSTLDLFSHRDQARDSHLERIRQAHQGCQGGIAHPTFDIADVGAMQTGRIAQLFLGQRPLATDTSHGETNGLGHLH
jgi:hypothetical protein